MANDTPPSVIPISPETQRLEGVSMQGLSLEEQEIYKELVSSNTPSIHEPYIGETFSDILKKGGKDGTIGPEKLKNLINTYKSPEHGQWKEIFIRNSELAKVSPEQAKAEKNAWKQIPGMMDDWREWKATENMKLSEKVIDTSKLADAKGMEAINTSKLADAKGMEAIAEEQRLQANSTEAINNKEQQQKEIERITILSLSLLDQKSKTEVENTSEQELTKILESEKGEQKSNDNRIVRNDDGKINREMTLSRIQAYVLVEKAPKFLESMDPIKQKEFQKNIETLSSMIGKRIEGLPKVLSTIREDSSLPYAVARRHEESAKTILSGATGVNARRYGDGTYIIDYQKGGHDEKLILDGVGNVTRVRAGLEITKNTAKDSYDIKTREQKEINNKEHDNNNAISLNYVSALEGGMCDDLNILPDKSEIIPNLERNSEEMKNFSKLVFPGGKEEGQKIIESMKEHSRKNNEKIKGISFNDGDPDKALKEGRKQEIDNKNARILEKIQGLETEIGKYQNLNEEDTQFQKGVSSFETIANNNLEALILKHADRMGDNAQEALERIIGFINKFRDEKSKIHLDKPISIKDLNYISTGMEKLGGTEKVLTSSQVGGFQKRISEIIGLPRSNPRSIEGLLGSKETPKSETT